MIKIKMRTLTTICILGLTVGTFLRAQDRPNVVVIMTDDQGTLDLNSYGAKDLFTPNFDRMAENGVRFTQFYVGSSVCSPSRATLLTGKSPPGAGLTGNSGKTGGLPSEQVTIAEMLKPEGYATAHIGKWHLGKDRGRRPEDQGFDYTFGHMEGCIDNYSHFFYWSGPNYHDLWENGKEVYEDGYYFQDSLVEKARRFIYENKDQPFFIYFAINLPHYPLQPDAKWLEHYKDLPSPRKNYAACVSTVDEKVGKLIGILDSAGELDNTLVIFLSDHGHSVEERTMWGGGFAGPYRGSKFGFFEGGLRVPAIIMGPGISKGIEIHNSAMSMDLLPTIADYCEVSKLPQGVEGTSLRSMLTGQDKRLRDTMYWNMKNDRWAVRYGSWKLLFNPRDDTKDYPPLDPKKDRYFLANLDMDKSESRNLVREYPEKARELIEVYKGWEHALPVEPLRL
ncbi:MAG: sulfatase-like hydrolase/transferase [Verrucomicrobia bacterium]|nr:sulfatase-like hydrolase/transferase [Verrucomicrobiota bacterium]